MALTVKAIGNRLVTALRDSTPILNESVELYYKPHTVNYGSTGSKAPTVDDFPAFAVIPWGKDRGEDDTDRIYRFGIMLTLEDEVITETTTDAGVIVKVYRGTDTLEDMLDMAQTAIKAISTELFYNDLAWEFETIEYYPLFVGQVIMEISYPVLIGQYETSQECH